VRAEDRLSLVLLEASLAAFNEFGFGGGGWLWLVEAPFFVVLGYIIVRFLCANVN
jgi:hypothetical protein